MLGFTTRLEQIGVFESQASYQEEGAEHGICSVFTGICDGEVPAGRR